MTYECIFVCTICLFGLCCLWACRYGVDVRHVWQSMPSVLIWKERYSMIPYYCCLFSIVKNIFLYITDIFLYVMNIFLYVCMHMLTFVQILNSSETSSYTRTSTTHNSTATSNPTVSSTSNGNKHMYGLSPGPTNNIRSNRLRSLSELEVTSLLLVENYLLNTLYLFFFIPGIVPVCCTCR